MTDWTARFIGARPPRRYSPAQDYFDGSLDIGHRCVQSAVLLLSTLGPRTSQ